MAVVCLSVSLSVCLSFMCSVYDPKSITEGRSKLKIGRKEAHRHEVERSSVCRETGKFWRRTASVFYRDVNVQWTISVLGPPISKLKLH